MDYMEWLPQRKKERTTKESRKETTKVIAQDKDKEKDLEERTTGQ